MMGRRYGPWWGRLLGVWTVLAAAGSAGAQVGAGVNRPSSFYTPLSSFGGIGGRYTRSTTGFAVTAPNVSAPTASLASGSTALPALGGVGGGMPAYQFSLLNLPQAAPTLNVIAPVMALPMGLPLGAPMAAQIGGTAPDYDVPQVFQRDPIFEPTIRPDSFTGIQPYRRVSLLDVTPAGPPAGAIESAQRPQAPASQPATDQQITSMREVSQRQLAKFSDQGEACLQRAMDALKNEQYHDQRSGSGAAEPYKPGAIELFRQARLLLTGRPEPTMGLIASLVATADYSQAASLIGPLAGTWPDVLSRGNFAQQFYGRPDQMHKHLLAIRTAAAGQADPDVRLLGAFYRWHVENKQVVFAEVLAAARQGEANSPAAQLAEAMRKALVAAGG